MIRAFSLRVRPRPRPILWRFFSARSVLFSEEHEWVKEHEDSPGTVTIGITDYAQKELGDIVYVDLPKVDDDVQRGEPFGSVESVKAANDLFAPVSGTVVQINGALEDEP